MTDVGPAVRVGRLPGLPRVLSLGVPPVRPAGGGGVPGGSGPRAGGVAAAGVLLAVAVLALGVRLGPLLASGGLRSLMGYDDGVHLAAAQEVVAGSLPYADFTFLQPPGVVVVMLPFAVLGELVGTDVALAAARLAVIAVGVLNAVLVAVLLRAVGVGAQLVGGGLYAGWAAVVVGERTVWLEPLLNVGVLGALLLLAGGLTARRLAAVGVLLGVLCSIKLWPVLLAVGLLLALLVVDRRGAWLCAGGLALGGLLWGVPTLLVAGRAAFAQVVTVQAGRGRQVPVTERLSAFDGTEGIVRVREAVPMSVRALLVLAVLLVLLAVGVRLRLHLWTALAAITLVEVVVLAPSFYTHYTTYAAPGLCLLAGAAFSRVPRRWVVPAGTGCALTGALLAFSATNHTSVPQLPLSRLQAFTDAHRCVWTNDRTALLLADAATPRDRSCPNFVDGFGHALRHDPRTRDRTALAQLRRSDAALVVDPQVAAWPRRPTNDIHQYLRRNFTRHPTDLAPLTAWTRNR